MQSSYAVLSSCDKDAGQDLDRGRLAGAVGPDVADGLAALDREAHAIEGAPHVVLPREAAADGSQGTREAAVGSELPRQIAHLDEGHGCPPDGCVHLIVPVSGHHGCSRPVHAAVQRSAISGGNAAGGLTYMRFAQFGERSYLVRREA